MSVARTYLDWNASAPLRPEARVAMIAALDVAGNPSSVHAEGRAARRIIEDAREAVAALVGARPQEVIFTSGATEANATIAAGRSWGLVAAPQIEHPSVLQPLSSLLSRATIAVAPEGLAAIDDELVSLLTARSVGGLALVSLQLANSEFGVIQDVAKLVQLCRDHCPAAVVHTDAVQAVGRIPVNFAALGVAAMTVSSHKLGGPQGVGGLILRDGLELSALITGGGQEQRRRAGTENVAAIAGFGAAARAALADLPRMTDVAQRRDRLEAEVAQRTCGAIVIGKTAPRLPNTSCIAFPGYSAETLVAAFDLAGVAVSAGSACSSGKVTESHVLRAMGLPPEIARSAIRISQGLKTTDADIARFLAALDTILTRSAARKAA